MTRKVVDSNFLRSDALSAYLSESSQNCVLLTDYVAIEAYKGEMPASIYASMAILTRYPHQVIVLKNTADVCGLHPSVTGSPEQLIDLAKLANSLNIARPRRSTTWRPNCARAIVDAWP